VLVPFIAPHDVGSVPRGQPARPRVLLSLPATLMLTALRRWGRSRVSRRDPDGPKRLPREVSPRPASTLCSRGTQRKPVRAHKRLRRSTRLSAAPTDNPETETCRWREPQPPIGRGPSRCSKSRSSPWTPTAGDLPLPEDRATALPHLDPLGCTRPNSNRPDRRPAAFAAGPGGLAQHARYHANIPAVGSQRSTPTVYSAGSHAMSDLAIPRWRRDRGGSR